MNFWKLIAALFGRNASKPPAVIAPDVPKTRALVVSVFNGPAANDEKVAGAMVSLKTAANPNGPEGVTDGAGNWTYLGLPCSGEYDVTVTLDGWAFPGSTHVSVLSGNAPALVMIEGAPAIKPWAPRVLHGRASLNGRAWQDGDGTRPLIGASMFWSAWGFRNDKERLAANYRWLAQHGVDYVRALGEVGGGLWTSGNRVVDPEWPDYVDVVRGTTQLANSYGLRVEWTIFGGGTSQTDAQFRAATQRVVEALRPVVGGVQFVEIQNEELGPSNALARELAAYMRSQLGVEVAITGTPEKGLGPLYSGSAATLTTVHFDRAPGDWGWRFARQSWGFYEIPGVPARFTSNEPKGSSSSVAFEKDRVRIASDALVTWISGGASYVWHSGDGIYGLEHDHATAGHRYANVFDRPGAAEELGLIASVRDALPADVANWARANNGWSRPNPEPPFRFESYYGDAATQAIGITRAYSATRGDEFCTVLLGVRGALTSVPVRSVTATIRDLKDFGNPTAWTGTVTGDDTTFLVVGK
jgi:hypothetical protein